jgi:pimeloyl-ACP methyl ester carboxylesterase
MTGIGALQPMAAGFAAGSDLAGTSGAGIARSCPFSVAVSTLPAQVSVPTLVMHARDDAVVPFDQGRRLAGGIPGARFVPLASRNHLILEDEPAFPRFLAEMRAFLNDTEVQRQAQATGTS